MARSFAGGANTDNIAFANFQSHTQRTIFVKFNAAALDATTGRIFEWNSGTLIDSIEHPSTKLQYNLGWDGTSGQWSISAPSTGAWHYLVITYDGGSTSNDPVIYLDGSSQTVTEVTAPTGSLHLSTQTIAIENRTSDNARCFNGLIAEYARWDRILSAGEIDLLAKDYSPRFISRSLIFYSPLIGKASPEPDIKGGLTGTVTGATAAAHPRIIRSVGPQIIPVTAGSPPPVTTRFNIMGTVGM